MPTPEVTGSAASHSEEIKKLSEAYAEYMCPVGDYCGGVYDDVRNFELPIYKDDAKSVLEWLCKTHCIVPKERIRADYNYNAPMSARFSGRGSAKCAEISGWHQGKCDELISLFGKSLFNEEKE